MTHAGNKPVLAAATEPQHKYGSIVTITAQLAHLHQRVDRLLIVRSNSNLLLSHTSSAALAPLLPPAV
jgi:hypothetical protein